MPSIFRGTPSGKYFDETSLFNHFQLRSPSFRHEHHSMFEWLCLMQHYAAPTRLLDWTESVLIGLYFAVEDAERKEDAALYILNARLLNQASDVERQTPPRPAIHVPSSFNVILRALMAEFRELPEIFHARALQHLDETDSPDLKVLKELKKLKELKNILPPTTLMADAQKFFTAMLNPVAVYPYRANHRLLAQQGTFTIHGGKVYLDNDGKMIVHDGAPQPFDLSTCDNYLKKCIIPQGSKERLKRELEVAGIHKGALFPELDKQSEYMREIWQAG